MKLFKRTLMTVLALLLLLSTFTQATSALAAVMSQPKVTVLENKFIKITVDNQTGRFGIRTVDGQPIRKQDDNVNMLFRGDDPDTSFTSFRIDGTDYIFGNPYKFGADFFSEITSPQIVENSNGTKQIETVWTIKGVAIKQILMLYANTEDKLNAGNVNIRYEVLNNSGAQVEMGTRILLDTQVAGNDGPQFQIGTGYRVPLMVERKLVHNPEDDPNISEEDRLYYKIPPYWVMRDKFDLTNPLATNVVAYGFNNIYEGNIRLVDEMIVGHWNGLANTKWDYTPNGNLDFTRDTNDYGTADSAVAFYWQPKALDNKAVQTFETVYGLGEIIEPDKVFSIRFMDPPQQLGTNADNSAYEGEGIFEITAEIENLAMFHMEHSEVTAQLSLESGLNFVRRDEKSGEPARDASGQPIIEAYRSKEFTYRKQATKEEAENGILPKYKPGDTLSVSFLVQAKGRPWPTSKQYMLTAKSPETVKEIEGIQDEGLKAQYESSKGNFVLLPAIGQASPTYVYGLAPKELYSTDVKYITVNMTNIEAYTAGNAQVPPNFDLYLKEKATGKRYKVPVKDSVIMQPADDGFSGDMRITYRGGDLVDDKGQVMQSGLGPELPLGEYQVEIDFNGDTGGDAEIAAMYDVITKQTFKVTNNQESRIREAGLMAVYKQYVDLSSVTSATNGRYLDEINEAFPGRAFQSGALLNDAVKALKEIKRDIVGPGSKLLDPKFKLDEFTSEQSLKKVPAYQYRLFESEKEMTDFFKEKDANDNFIRTKLVDIRGMIKEVGTGDDKQVIVDTKTEPALINEAVAYKGKDMVFVRGKLDIFDIPKKISGYDKIPFLDSLFVKGEGKLSVANSGFVFYSGEWTLDFFNGFEKELAPSLTDSSHEIFPDEDNPEDDSLNGTISWATGALGDRLNPVRQLMLTHVYFNKHSLFAAPGFMVGGFGFTFNDFILRPGGISFGGKLSMKIVDGEVRNVVFNDKGFVGVDAQLKFDLGKDLGLFESKKKEKDEKKKGESKASGELTVIHYVQSVPNVSNRYGISFKADVKGKFEVQAELAFKQVRDGRVLPDVVAFGTTLGKPGVLITGATYLSAVRGAVRELADTIAGGTKDEPFPLVIQAGVEARFGVQPVFLIGNVDMTVKRSGLAILGKLDLSTNPDGDKKINMVTKALLEAQWFQPWFVRVEAEIDIGGWGVIMGKAGIFVGQNLEKGRIDFEGYIGARLQIPNGVPVVGGMPLSSVFLGLNNDKVWGSVGILFISLGITYYWGGGVEFGTSQEDLPEGFAHLLIEDPEKGPQLMVIGQGMSTVATSWIDAEKDNHEIVYRDISEGVKLVENSAMEAGIGGIHVKDGGRTHQVPMGGVSGNAIIEFEYDEAEVPAVTLKDKSGALYPVMFDNTNTNPAANAFTQFIPADQSSTKADVRKAYIIIPQAKAQEGGTWTLTSMKPVASRLLNVPMTADLKQVGIAAHGTDPNKFTASWQVENARSGDTIDLYLTKDAVTSDTTVVNGQQVLDPGEPGVLIAKEVRVDSGTLNGAITSGELVVDVSDVELMGKREDLRGLLQQGDYYLRAALKSSASFKTKTSAERFRIVDPLAPGEVEDLHIEPAGNGLFSVSFRPAAKKPGQEASEHSYAISAMQETNGKLTAYPNFAEQLFTEDELKPYWKANSGKYEGILVGGWTEFSNSSEVNTTDLTGPKPAADEKKTYLGLEAGQRYVLSVASATRRAEDQAVSEKYHFADSVNSVNTLLPIPAEPKLGLAAGSYPDYLEVLTNQTKPTIHLYADQSDIEVEAFYNEQSIGKTGLVNNGSVSEGTIAFDSFETDGTFGIELRATNKRTKDRKVTFMYLNVDTSAPILYLDEPTSGQRTIHDKVTVAGTTSKDAKLTVYVDQVAEGTGVSIPVADNGRFAGSVPVLVDKPDAELIFVARDGAGNENRASVAVSSGSFKAPAALVIKRIDALKPGEQVIVEPFLKMRQGKDKDGKAIYVEVPMTPEQSQRVAYSVSSGDAVGIREVQVKDAATGKDRKLLQLTAGTATGASLIQANYDVAAHGTEAEDEASASQAELDTLFAISVKVPAPTSMESYTVTTQRINATANATKVQVGDTGEQSGYQLVYKVFAKGAGAAIPSFKAELKDWTLLPQNGVVSAAAGDKLVVAKRTSLKQEAVGSSAIVTADVWTPTIGGGGGGPMAPQSKDSVKVNDQTLMAERKNDTLTVHVTAASGADLGKGDLIVTSDDVTVKDFSFRFDKALGQQAVDKQRNIRIQLPQASLVLTPDMLKGMLHDLEVKIRPNGAPAIRAMKQLASEMKGTLLGGGEGIEIVTNLPEASRSAYLHVRLPVPASIQAGDIQAVILRGMDGEWTTVPWKLETADGQSYLLARLTGDGSLAFLHTAPIFADVADDFWGKPGIEAAAAKLFMQGKAEEQFDPESRITRAEYPTVLLRVAGWMNRRAESDFTDVALGDWYSRSISIAAKLGIVDGLEDGSYAPQAPLTRVEAMTMAGRLMEALGMNSALADEEIEQLLSVYEDRQLIPAWARKQTALSIKYGIIQGEGSTVNPLGALTRAQAAAIAVRLDQWITSK
ncbi:S-layer homology domain-containing protein [Paenibacillus puerhi]|uniref:S-layer homology domain-containing protein n=1 Tax=Paenibacillus puerhi TaxID=2692622 RepID=UPI00135BBA0D|nr:S-layer homology domain-containing protein [Paenibacillus puerhi]